MPGGETGQCEPSACICVWWSPTTWSPAYAARGEPSAHMDDDRGQQPAPGITSSQPDHQVQPRAVCVVAILLCNERRVYRGCHAGGAVFLRVDTAKLRCGVVSLGGTGGLNTGPQPEGPRGGTGGMGRVTIQQLKGTSAFPIVRRLTSH